MNPWLLAALVLTAAIVPCGVVCAVVTPMAGLVAMEVASTVATVVLMALTEGTERQSFIDIAVVFAALSMLGAIAFARLLEHDL